MYTSEYGKEYRQKHKEDINKKNREWRSRNIDKSRMSVQNSDMKRRVELRRRVLDAYGGMCECCGESRIEFLTLDHSLKDGNVHARKVGGRGTRLYSDIVKKGFPKDCGYRVLCMNCNWSIGLWGYCPHNRDGT